MRGRTRRRVKAAVVGVVVTTALAATAAMVSASQTQTPPAATSAVGTYLAAQATVTPTPTPSFKAVPAGAPVLIIGDSFSQGYGADNAKEQGYARVLADSEGWNATISGVGGTGFVWHAGKAGNKDNAFIDRLKAQKWTGIKPKLVILQGGINDRRATREEIAGAIHATVTLARSTWPEAQVLVIAPMPVHPHGNNLRKVASALAVGCISSGAFFIDPNRLGWLTVENTPQYAYKDGVHLNTAGHALVASKIKETLDAYT